MLTLRHGDNRDVLKTLADNSIDSIVTDPPYELGFMGKGWDNTGIANDPALWAECLRVLKPGGHVVAFSGTRTYHRMACAIEDAGFEIRDQLQWLYGTGFPKSHNHLKPANEPIVLARKPLSEKTVAANVLAHGTGAINVDGCRVAVSENEPESYMRGERSIHAKRLATDSNSVSLPPATLSRSDLGRWPANVLHDGSDEVVGAFPETAPSTKLNCVQKARDPQSKGAEKERIRIDEGYTDSGSAARFFYSAKASRADRAGSKHPTVKPIALMRWLCRLVTPPGGTVLDPFAGSGTTGAAALAEGFNAILIEREAEYFEDIKRRFDEGIENGTARTTQETARA